MMAAETIEAPQKLARPRLFVDPQTTRTLHGLAVQEGPTGLAPIGKLRVGAVVDVETTGKDSRECSIIELAIRRFLFDEEGQVIRVGGLHTWREDPGCTLEPRIAQLTGLSDADLVGQQIDEAAVMHLLETASLVIAHNAEFDRRCVERRLPQLRKLAWACTLREIDWFEWGFDGLKLGHLCMQIGLFFGAHRAGTDVDALLALLSHEVESGRPLLYHLCERADLPSYRVEAVGAAFALKDQLKSRGYHWDAEKRVWWIEVSEFELQEEQFWLAGSIYGHPACSALGPKIIERSALDRYS